MANELNDLIPEIYGTTPGDKAWGGLLARLCEAFNAHGAWLTDGSDESASGVNAFWNVPPRKVREQLALASPRETSANLRDKAHAPVIKKHILLLDEQRDTRPFDIAIFRNHAPEASFGVAFAANETALNEQTVGALERIYGHLQRALELRNAADRRAKQYEEILNALSVPLLLLQPDREIVFSNRAAKEMFAGQGALIVMANRLASTEPHLQSLLQGKIDAVVAAQNGQRTTTAMALGEKGNNAVLHLSATASNGGRAVLAAVRPGLGVEARDMRVVREVFGLSDVESEIAGLVLENMAPRSIANIRQTSEQTVRWHLKNIYSKTATRGFRGLILRMLSACSPFR